MEEKSLQVNIYNVLISAVIILSNLYSLLAKTYSAGKKIHIVMLQECLCELRVLVASATCNIGLGAFLFCIFFSVYTMYCLLE